MINEELQPCGTHHGAMTYQAVGRRSITGYAS